MTITEREIEASVEELRRILDVMDFHRRKIGEAALDRAVLIRSLYTGGLSMAEIAGRLGVSRQNVHRVLRDLAAKEARRHGVRS